MYIRKRIGKQKDILTISLCPSTNIFICILLLPYIIYYYIKEVLTSHVFFEKTKVPQSKLFIRLFLFHIYRSHRLTDFQETTSTRYRNRLELFLGRIGKKTKGLGKWKNVLQNLAKDCKKYIFHSNIWIQFDWNRKLFIFWKQFYLAPLRNEN